MIQNKMEAIVYNQKGTEAGTLRLPENIFGLPWNEKLVHQVVTSMVGNKRIPIAHTKNRGEVSGTGAKPWRQKGTGRARHGSRRSPIWVGGGIAHGPRNEKNYSRKINKKMKTKAFFTLLSKKLKDKEIVFINEISLKAPKTKEAKTILESISKIKNFTSITKRKNAAFVTFQKKDDNLIKSFRNFSNLELGQAKDLSLLDLLKYKFLVLTDPEKSLLTFSSRAK